MARPIRRKRTSATDARAASASLRELGVAASTIRYAVDVLGRRVADGATLYALLVRLGEIVAGPWVRLACDRHIRWLERDDIAWSRSTAEKRIQFFPDVLRLTFGEHKSVPFKPALWQQFVIGSLFGWQRLDGTRLFRTAYVEIGKGNGKSPLAAGVGILGLTADDEAKAEVYAAATKKDQAMILFRDAVDMVNSSPALKKRLTTSGGRMREWNLAHLESGSFFRPISSDEDSQSGPRPHFGLIDELHEHKSPIIVNMMKAGFKGRRQPLLFEITNSGFDRTSVCWEHHEYSTSILQGLIDDDTWFAYVCAIDEGDDWSDETTWPKTNPNLGVSIQLDYLREQVKSALAIPSQTNLVKRLNFCIWTEQDSIGVPLDQWDACADQVDLAALRGRECYGALDLSSTTDLCAFQLLFPGTDGAPAVTIGRSWIPSEGLQLRIRRDKVPYDAWLAQGLIEKTDGNIVDYEVVRAGVHEIATWCRIREIAYDPFNATHLVTQLTSDGFEMVPVRQTYTGLSAATKETLRLIATRQLRHDGNALTRYQVAGVALEQDPAMNIRPSKKKSRRRIDNFVALVMAVDRASRNEMLPTSIYEQRHLEDPPGENGAPAPADRGADQRPEGTTPPAAPQPGAGGRRQSIYDSVEWTQHREELTR